MKLERHQYPMKIGHRHARCRRPIGTCRGIPKQSD
jgi:hypothetical protein